MNKTTKKFLGVSIILLIIASVVFSFFLYRINVTGAKLSSFITTLNERQAQEASFIRITRLVEDTKDERESIGRAFFSDESDSISFLGEIESFAEQIDLNLKTENLNKVESADKKNEYISMTFVYTGTESVVQNFNKYLELIPYHSRVESLSLRKNMDGLWEGRLTLHITLVPS